MTTEVVINISGEKHVDTIWQRQKQYLEEPHNPDTGGIFVYVSDRDQYTLYSTTANDTISETKVLYPGESVSLESQGYKNVLEIRNITS